MVCRNHTVHGRSSFGEIVSLKQPTIKHEDGQAASDVPKVIPFRPRQSSFGRPTPVHHQSPDLDLSRYERDEPDDYRHRMIMNVAAGIVTVALTAFGIWLATSIADLRRTTDCILVGRLDCAGIPSHHR